MSREARNQRLADRVLAAIGTLRYATSDLIARWAYMNASDVRRVLPLLNNAGLIYRAGHGKWSINFLTDKGAEKLGYRSRGRTSEAGWGKVRHEMAVAEVMLAWRSQGWDVSPAIDMMHQHHLDLAKIPTRRAYRSRFHGGLVHPSRPRVPQAEVWNIIPDFEATHPSRPGRLAVEIEMSRKEPLDIDIKLIDYLAQSTWSRVVYYTDVHEVGRLLRRRIALTEASDRVIVREMRLPEHLQR